MKSQSIVQLSIYWKRYAKQLTKQTPKVRVNYILLFFSMLIIFLVKKVVPVALSPPGSTPWQHQGSISPTPPSPSSLSSGSMSPSKHDTSWVTTDLSLSSCSISSDKRSSHFWHATPVNEWNKEQVHKF